MTTFRAIVAWLAALSADPSQIDREPPRAAAAVAVAYSGFAVDAPPSPAPTPAKGCGCEGKCEGGHYKPDGKITMPCEKDCPCKCRAAAGVAEAPYPDGKSPPRPVKR